MHRMKVSLLIGFCLLQLCVKWKYLCFFIFLCFRSVVSQVKSFSPLSLYPIYICLFLRCSVQVTSFCFLVDLREDKQFFADHPGAVPITTAQVYCCISRWINCHRDHPIFISFLSFQEKTPLSIEFFPTFYWRERSWGRWLERLHILNAVQRRSRLILLFLARYLFVLILKLF